MTCRASRPTPQNLKDHRKTRLYQQLKKREKEAEGTAKTRITSLKATVDAVADVSEQVSKLVVRYMPQYTLHDERHQLNVLGLMDALIADDALPRLQPLECGLIIMSSFIHDLGMALSAERHQAITNPETEEGKQFQNFCDERFTELLRQKEKLLHLAAEGDPEAEQKAKAIHGHMLAEYLRVTHTADWGPVSEWLEKMESDGKPPVHFVYGNTENSCPGGCRTGRMGTETGRRRNPRPFIPRMRSDAARA